MNSFLKYTLLGLAGYGVIKFLTGPSSGNNSAPSLPQNNQGGSFDWNTLTNDLKDIYNSWKQTKNDNAGWGGDNYTGPDNSGSGDDGGGYDYTTISGTGRIGRFKHPDIRI